MSVTSAAAERPALDTGERGTIAVAPAGGLRRYRRLFSALEACYPVTFADGEVQRPRARLILDADPGATARLADSGDLVPQLVVLGVSGRAGATIAVALADAQPVPVALRGGVLREHHGAPVAPLPEAGTALARCDGAPAWVRLEAHPLTHVSGVPLSELAPGEPLRAHMRAGCFAALLPLLELIAKASPVPRWSAQPLRACFIVDDPNLQRPTYGHIDYARLAARAHAGGYHVAIATVPIDAWRVEDAAARVFRENPRALSLLVHGNDHTKRELAQLDTPQRAERALAQALRRIERLERATGLHVAKVMAPPHGACSAQALRAMARLGFEAACISRPRPWLAAGQPQPVESGWRGAELVAGGMPVLARHPIGGDPEELVLRAVLGHPMIVYCHHQDLAEPDALDRAAAEIESLGCVQWLAPEAIVRASHRSRREGETLHVELETTRARVYVPPGCRRLRVALAQAAEPSMWHALRCGERRVPLSHDASGRRRAEFEAMADATVEVRLEPGQPLDPRTVPAPRRLAWPHVRRGLVQARDRWEGRRRS